MFFEYRAPGVETYKMNVRSPHVELEPAEREVAVVDKALAALVRAGALPHGRYDNTKFLAHREAARSFEIPWTAITPRMQRVIYAINAVAAPSRMLAAGVFCGFTFISNAGAAVGPGACYEAAECIGLEIKPEEAQRAERNVRKIDSTGVARVVAADAVAFVAEYPWPINLLYLDADGKPDRGKGIYLDILQAGLSRMPPGSLVLAHNSVNAAKRLEHYLAFVRDSANFRASVNLIVDNEGLEVSVK